MTGPRAEPPGTRAGAESRERDHGSNASAFRTAVISALYARIVIALGFLVAVLASNELLADHPLPLRQHLLAWDGAWYADIARDGYESVAPDGLRFFPLFPLLGRLLAIPLRGNVDAALVLVANASVVAFGFLAFRLVVHERGDRDLARRSVWLVAVFPAATVLALAYSEPVAMTLAAAGFLALRRQRWGWAAAAGLLLGLARPVGVVFALPALVEASRNLRSASIRDRLARAGAVVAPLGGLAAYLLWTEHQFGDGMEPIRAHERGDLRGEFVFPLLRVAQAAGRLVTGGHLGEGLHVPFIALFVFLVIVLFRRWPASYGFYVLALLIVALSAESLGSFERYALAAFPLFFALADIVSRPALERVTVGISSAGLVSFTALILLGVFVP